MGKVQSHFPNGFPGAVSRSVDDIIIAVRNAGQAEIPFGAPVFMTSEGAVPFDTGEPQDFSAFLGFAVRAADKTPDTYPAGQFDTDQAGSWKPGDIIEVLVRGGVVVPITSIGARGGKVYLRKSDGRLTTSAGTQDSTVWLENVRISHPRDSQGTCCEVVVNKRNIL